MSLDLQGACIGAAIVLDSTGLSDKEIVVFEKHPVVQLLCLLYADADELQRFEQKDYPLYVARTILMQMELLTITQDIVSSVNNDTFNKTDRTLN